MLTPASLDLIKGKKRRSSDASSTSTASKKNKIQKIVETNPSLYSNEDDDYIPQLVQTHEIKVSKAKMMDVKSLLQSAREKHSIVFRVADLLFVNPFFDIDIKKDVEPQQYQNFFRDFTHILQWELEIDHSNIHFYRKEESNGIHVVVTGYRITLPLLKQLILVLKESYFFETNYEEFEFDFPVMYGIPGFVKEGTDYCYRHVKTNQIEETVFPKRNDVPLLINLSTLMKSLSKATLNTHTPRQSFPSYDLSTFRSLDSSNVFTWVCHLIGREFNVDGQFVWEYICRATGDFRSLVYELYLIHDKSSAKKEYTKLCSKLLWTPLKEILEYKQYEMDLENCIQKIGEHIDEEELLEIASMKTESSLLFHDASHNTILPLDVSIALWSDVIDRKNDDNYFLWVINQCEEYLKSKGFEIRKEHLIQYIMWDEYRFKHLIYRMYELEFGSKDRCVSLFEKLCSSLGWSFKTYSFSTNKKFKKDLTIREILFNILVMKSTSSADVDLYYDLTDQTISFNRHFIDMLLSTYSTGYSNSDDFLEIGNRVERLSFMITLIYHIFPIVMGDHTERRDIFVKGRVYTTTKGTIRSVLANIFQFYRPKFPPFDLQSTEWLANERHSAVFYKIFNNSLPCILVTADGWILHGGDVIYNTYSLVTHGKTLKLDFKTIKEVMKCRSFPTEKQVKNIDASILCPNYDMLYALQFLYGIQSYNWNSTLKLVKLLRDCVNFRANRAIIIFYGAKGMNGKSHLVASLEKILGPYWSTIDPSFFTSTSDHNSDVVKAADSALAIIDEYDIFKKNLDEEKLKRLTGQTPFSGRIIKEAQKQILFKGGLVVTTNDLSKCESNAILLRSFIFTFFNTVIVKAAKKHLDISWKATKGGILLMADEFGLDRNYNNRFINGLVKLIFADFDIFNNDDDINWRDHAHTKEINDDL